MQPHILGHMCHDGKTSLKTQINSSAKIASNSLLVHLNDEYITDLEYPYRNL